jgi:hypothetical protein
MVVGDIQRGFALGRRDVVIEIGIEIEIDIGSISENPDPDPDPDFDFDRSRPVLHFKKRCICTDVGPLKDLEAGPSRRVRCGTSAKYIGPAGSICLSYQAHWHKRLMAYCGQGMLPVV